MSLCAVAYICVYRAHVDAESDKCPLGWMWAKLKWWIVEWKGYILQLKYINIIILSQINDGKNQPSWQDERASSCLGILPIKEHVFALHKGTFRDSRARSFIYKVWLAGNQMDYLPPAPYVM